MLKPKPLKSVLLVFAFKQFNSFESIVCSTLKQIYRLKGIVVSDLKRLCALRGIAVVALISLGLALTFVTAFFMTTTPTKAYAAPPDTLNFQARLENASGSIVPDGDYTVSFHLFNAATSPGSTDTTCGSDSNCLWAEEYTGGNAIHVANGYMSVNLGSITAFGIINWDQQLYLTMDVYNGSSWDGQMSPRLLLTSVPYAFESQDAEELNELQGSATDTLQFATDTSNSNAITLPDLNGSFGLMALQTTTNVLQTGGFNVSGTGVAGSLEISTSGSLDTSSAGTLDIGLVSGGNATAISLNQNTTVTGTKTLTVGGLISANGGLTVAANKSLTLTTGTGQVIQGYFTTSNGSAYSLTVTNTNTSASSVSVGGLNIQAAGSANSSGTNTTNGVLFSAVTPQTGNSFYGLNFGTGYNDILRYNGAQLISGMGILQNSAIGSSVNYSNLTQIGALTSGSIGSGFGTISTSTSITTTATVQGGVVNATSTLELGGLNINTASTLSNVAYLNAAGQTFTGANTFKNTSTTAFQIQPAGSSTPVLDVDTSNSRVGINTNSPGYTLDVTASGIPLRLSESGTGYENGILFTNSGTDTGEIGIAGASNNIVNGTVSGDMGIKSAGGNILFAAGSNTDALKLQTNGNLSLETGALVLYNSGTAPTEVDGGMYYNTNDQTFECGINTEWIACSGGLVSETITVSGGLPGTTTTPTAFNNESNAFTPPINDCTSGVEYRISATGQYNIATSGSNQHFNIAVDLVNGSNITTLASISSHTAGQSNDGNTRPWTLDGTITCNGGSGDTGIFYQFFLSEGFYTSNEMATIWSTPIAVYTYTWPNDGTNQFQLKGWWSSSAGASSFLTLDQFSIERLAP